MVCGQARIHNGPGSARGAGVSGVGDRLFLLFSSYSAGTAQHQLAAWVVEDLEAEVTELRGRGVVFEEYD